MKKIFIPITVILLLVITSCNDDFLNRNPTHNITHEGAWVTANDLKVYNNGIYNAAGDNGANLFFRGNGNNSNNSGSISAMFVEAKSDNSTSSASQHTTHVKIAAGQEVLEANAVAGGWKWEILNRCNYFMENYKRVQLEDAIINKYAGEVLFFRAWFYLDKVQMYGNVPLSTKYLTETSPELFHKQTDRKVIMDTILNDIDRAIAYLPKKWGDDHPDRVTKWVAYALKSRICLYEGTYRKYHGLDGADRFLKEAVAASDSLMKSGKFDIYNTGNPKKDYRTLFTSDELSGNPECIFARTYGKDLGHRLSGYIVDRVVGATKDFVDDFLCIEPDGTAKPVALSTVFKEDAIEDVFDNRDARLAQTILDPRESSTILNRLSSQFPQLTNMKNGKWVTTTGYYPIKSYDYIDDLKGLNNETNDYPIFRYAEILLNYAEAKAELGELLPADLDISINKLRARAGMPNMDFNPVMDPKYAGEGLSSLLVEIRRERRVELSYEDFRYQDLMRWKKGSYLAKPVLGMRLSPSDTVSGTRYVGAKVKFAVSNGVSYIAPYAGGPYANEKRVFDEGKHYWHPIPINAIAKNPNLDQSPGDW